MRKGNNTNNQSNTNNNSTNKQCNHKDKDSLDNTKDIYHVPFLLIMVMITLWLNHSFGFEAGTLGNGTIVTIGLVTWIIVILVDYFRN